jgi:hypothetical protein
MGGVKRKALPPPLRRVCVSRYTGGMDRRALYDDDYFAWLQEQAAALRRFAHDRRDLPNDLDVEQIAEEIEDVGK